MFEVELQAARQNCHRQFLRIRGGQQKFHVRWWFFKGFQQCVKAVTREHMHLVDQVDFKAPRRRCVLNVVQQLPGVLDLGTGSRIHFYQINESILCDRHTGTACTTGLRADARITIEAFGQNTGNSGFPHTPGTGKQIGMVQPVVIEGIDQGPQHMLLPNHLAKIARAPLAGQNLITHGAVSALLKGMIIG